MPKIIEIINPSFRAGTSKTGKPWTLMQVKVDDGKQASIFSPAAIGDEVVLKYNEEFKNYTAEKMTAQKKQQEETEDTLKLILSALGRIERHLGITGIKPPEKPASEAGRSLEDVVIGPDEELEERIDYADIPF